MLADELDCVIGVDTHRDQHTLAVIATSTGAVVAQTVVETSARGYATALRFAANTTGGARAWAIEGAGHYGAGLSRGRLRARERNGQQADAPARALQCLESHRTLLGCPRPTYSRETGQAWPGSRSRWTPA